MRKERIKMRNFTEYNKSEVNLLQKEKKINLVEERGEKDRIKFANRSLKLNKHYQGCNPQNLNLAIQTNYTEGTEFTVIKCKHSSQSSKKTIYLSFFKDKLSQQTTDVCFSMKDPKSSLELSRQTPRSQSLTFNSKIQRAKQYQLKVQQYKQAYGKFSFSLSEVKLGIQPKKKKTDCVNAYVQNQFKSILGYQFSKLRRKDILPSLFLSKNKSVAKGYKRMAPNLKSNLLTISPLSFWK